MGVCERMKNETGFCKQCKHKRSFHRLKTSICRKCKCSDFIPETMNDLKNEDIEKKIKNQHVKKRKYLKKWKKCQICMHYRHIHNFKTNKCLAQGCKCYGFNEVKNG